VTTVRDIGGRTRENYATAVALERNFVLYDPRHTRLHVGLLLGGQAEGEYVPSSAVLGRVLPGGRTEMLRSVRDLPDMIRRRPRPRAHVATQQ
jgi:hypothetical protein